MKKFIMSVMVLLFSAGVCLGAWAPSRPTDSEKLKDTPALIRANWDAIATGTDASLLITNAKVSASAGIVDTKLATISTAGKVSGTAVTGLASLPAGAGAVPIANGGTGQTTRQASLDALLDTQTTASGKALVSNGTNASWGYPANLTIASQAQGDLLYYASAWTRLAKDTNATRYLSNQGTSNSPSWNQVNLANGVTGTLPIANGGTGQTTASTAINALLPTQTDNSGKFLTTNGSVASWSSAGMTAYSSGSYLEGIIASSEYEQNGSAYAPNKSLSPVLRSGTVTVSWEMKRYNSGTSTSYGKVYVNGSAVGVEKTSTSDAYATYTDLITVSAGDVVAVYTKNSASGSTVGKNLKLLVSNPTIPQQVQ